MSWVMHVRRGVDDVLVFSILASIMSRRRALFFLINQLHSASVTTQYPKQVKTSRMHTAKLLRKEKKKTKQNKKHGILLSCRSNQRHTGAAISTTAPDNIFLVETPVRTSRGIKLERAYL
jgi:hypothetical protein